MKKNYPPHYVVTTFGPVLVYEIKNWKKKYFFRTKLIPVTMTYDPSRILHIVYVIPCAIMIFVQIIKGCITIIHICDIFENKFTSAIRPCPK